MKLIPMVIIAACIGIAAVISFIPVLIIIGWLYSALGGK